MENIWKLSLVFFGGGIGSVCRYLVEQNVIKLSQTIFPFATITVNLLGSFLIGIVFVLLEKNTLLDQHRLLIMTGFLGGFTTFSTLTLDSVNLIRNSHYANALVYILVSIIFGLIFVLLGIYFAMAFFRR